MARAECKGCGNELTDVPREGHVTDPDGWSHVDYPSGCPNEGVWNVEVQVKVRAANEDEAWRRVHDYMAATITGPETVRDPRVFDFDLLEESATREDEDSARKVSSR
jgi:hypothetical protein